MLLNLFPLALGGTVWQRTGGEFGTVGSKTNVIAWNDGVRLTPNNNTLNDWVRVSIVGPTARYSHAMAIHSPTGKVVLFGGLSPSISYNDTWVWSQDNCTWVNMSPKQSPPPRWGHSMVYDAKKDDFVMYGGLNFTGGTKGDTWSYNLTNNQWTRLSLSSSIPALAHFAMVYDAYLDQVQIIGGWDGVTQYNETWSLNRATNTWWTVPTTWTAQPPMDLAAAYDHDRNGTIVFGDHSSSDVTWFYSANMWSDLKPANPPNGRSDAAMAYHAQLKKTAMFGGSVYGTASDELWFYNKTLNAWASGTPANRPLARDETAMVYDEKRAELVLFGGDDDVHTPFGDTWIYGFKQYITSGYYISEARDMGGNATFGKIHISADLPDATEVRVQLRTAPSELKLYTKDYVGPDGTVNTFYNTTIDAINAMHNGDRWLQYKATLKTGNYRVTPLLRSVDIAYNLLQKVSVTSPAAGAVWHGTNSISWTASDLDNDYLKYDVLLVKGGTVNRTLATNLTTKAYIWDTTTVLNGIYTIKVVARDDNVSIPLTAVNGTKEFTIDNPLPNRAPTVELMVPADGVILLTDQVRMNWSGHDDDNDSLTYFVYLDTVNATTKVNTTTGTEYLAKGLNDNTTYHWTVKAFDGMALGTAAPVRSFKVQVNGPPKFTSTPNTNAYADLPFIYDANASDPDVLDILTFSLPLAPSGMTIDKNSGIIQWAPDTSMLGDHQVRVNVTDGHYSISQDFVLNVSRIPPGFNRPPRITSNPPTSATVGYKYTYNVTATDPDKGDTLNFSLVAGPTDMTIDLKTGVVVWWPDWGWVGKRSVTVRVSDGKANADQTFIVDVTVSAANHAPKINSQPQTTKVTAGKKWTYKINVTDQDDDKVGIRLEPWEGNAPTITGDAISWTLKKAGTYTLIINASDGKGGFDQQTVGIRVVNPPSFWSLGNPFLLLLIAVLIIVVVAAIGLAVWARRRKTEAAARAKAMEMMIDDIFLIYRDGRLISHHTRKLKPDVDDQVLTGMFTAVTDFIKSSFGGDDSKAVNEIAYGDDRILLEHGRYIYIAAVVTGENVKGMQAKMRTAVQNIEADYATVLKGWEGDVKALAGAKKWVQTLISGK